MTKAEALRIFGVTEEYDREQLTEHIENKMFELKKECMQKYMVPSLIKNKIRIVEEFIEAESTLNDVQHEVPALEAWKEQPTDKIQFLEQYERHISKLRLSVMNAPDFVQLKSTLQSLILCQEYFMVLFRLFFSDHYEALPEEVNTREIIDTGQLLHNLKAEDSGKDMSWAIEKELARIDKIQRLNLKT